MVATFSAWLNQEANFSVDVPPWVVADWGPASQCELDDAVAVLRRERRMCPGHDGLLLQEAAQSIRRPVASGVAGTAPVTQRGRRPERATEWLVAVGWAGAAVLVWVRLATARVWPQVAPAVTAAMCFEAPPGDSGQPTMAVRRIGGGSWK